MIAIRAIRPFRANVMDTLGEDYVRTARAKGAPEPQVMQEHVLWNGLLPGSRRC